ncbi:MAG TPA: lamin tail domain-containing protein [Anaerolineae bacterium]
MNVIVSAVTTLIVVRVLINQSAPRAVNAAQPAVLASPTSQSSDSAGAAQPDVAPSQTPAATRANAAARPSPTTAATKTPVKASTPLTDTTAAATTGQGKVRIGGVLFPGQHQRESVVIANDSNVDVVLNGWVLASSRNISYTFGNVTLFRSNFISLHTINGTDVPTDLFWNRSEPAWQIGDVLTLSNQGQVVTTYTVK